jgi:hypothetical protein
MVLLVLSLASPFANAQSPRGGGDDPLVRELISKLRQVDADQKLYEQARMDYRKVAEVGGGVFVVSAALATVLAWGYRNPQDSPTGIYRFFSKTFGKVGGLFSRPGQALVPSGEVVIAPEVSESIAGEAALDAQSISPPEKTRFARARAKIASLIPTGRDLSVGGTSVIAAGSFLVTDHELSEIDNLINRAERDLKEEKMDLRILYTSAQVR